MRKYFVNGVKCKSAREAHWRLTCRTFSVDPFYRWFPSIASYFIYSKKIARYFEHGDPKNANRLFKKWGLFIIDKEWRPAYSPSVKDLRINRNVI